MLSIKEYQAYCDELAQNHAEFQQIIEAHGYPHYQTRPADFTTLLRLIIEQQVSLSSAKACFDKLAKISPINPNAMLLLTDEALRSVGLSRQKTVYIRALSNAILDGSLDLEALKHQNETEVRTQLTAIKGIGNWTTEVFLLECLHHLDIFPIGDVALRNAMKKSLNLPKETTHDELLAIAERYRPLRSIATFIFWHEYVSSKNIDLVKLLQ